MRRLLHIIALLSVVLLINVYEPADAYAQNSSGILAVVPVKNGNIDGKVYRQFDHLVPKLKKISKNKAIKLECRYSGRSNSEQDVQNAYFLAARIEKYLRVRHKLNLDLWVTIDMVPKSERTQPELTIAVLSDSPKNLDNMQVNIIRN